MMALVCTACSSSKKTVNNTPATAGIYVMNLTGK